MKIPFLSFDYMHSSIRNEMVEAFKTVYDSYWYILGQHVEIFEKEYAGFSQVEYAVGVSNGLDALYLSLKSLGIGAGDEVIVPSNGYIATALAVTSAGATPVFAEPDHRTYNISPADIARRIGPRTKCIIPIHLYGQCCQMREIMDIATGSDLYVIEDNAQGHGSVYQSKVSGSWGHVNATSFYPGKNLGALGDAGAITTNSADLAQKVRTLRNYGSSRKYYNDVIGYNMRLDELQAALLSVKLRKLMEWTALRNIIANQYLSELSGLGDLVLPFVHPKASHVYHLFVVRTTRRDELMKFLSSRGIGTMIHYPVPPHLQEAYSFLGFGKGSFPVAEELAATSVSLPLWPGMTEEMVSGVCQAIKEFFNGK